MVAYTTRMPGGGRTLDGPSLFYAGSTVEDNQIQKHPRQGKAVLDESNSDDIINAVAGEGLFDMTLGLLEKECRTATQK